MHIPAYQPLQHLSWTTNGSARYRRGHHRLGAARRKTAVGPLPAGTPFTGRWYKQRLDIAALRSDSVRYLHVDFASTNQSAVSSGLLRGETGWADWNNFDPPRGLPHAIDFLQWVVPSRCHVECRPLYQLKITVRNTAYWLRLL